MHLLKVKLSSAQGMLTYDGREPGDWVNPETHGETLHPERTKDNYALVRGKKVSANGVCNGLRVSPHEGMDAAKEALDAAVERHVAKKGRAPRKDAVGLGQWCVTLPKGIPLEDANPFFNFMFRFLQERYGAENVPVAFVHMDETTPHMHVPVIAMREDSFQAKNIFNRVDLSSIHQAAEKKLNANGRSGILLDDEDVLGKALSNLDRKQMNVVKAYIADTVANETAVEREKLQQRENTLENRETALSGRENALNTRETKLKERETALERDRSSMNERTKQLDERERGLNERARNLDDEVDRKAEEKSQKRWRAMKAAETRVTGAAAASERKSLRDQPGFRLPGQ